MQLAVIIEDGCLAGAPGLDELEPLVLTEVRDGVVDHTMDEGRPKVHQHLLLLLLLLSALGVAVAVGAVVRGADAARGAVGQQRTGVTPPTHALRHTKK